jgi:PAS domain S-box-containing protein
MPKETDVKARISPKHLRIDAMDGYYRAVFQSASDAAFLIEASGVDAGRILDANLAASKLHGYTHQELLKMRSGELDTPEDAAKVPSRLKKILAHGNARFEVEHLRKDGSRFCVEVSSDLIDLHGRPCVVSFNRDITERKEVEAALRESEHRWKFAIEGAGDGLWDCDVPSGKAFFAHRWKEMLGLWNYARRFQRSNISQEIFLGGFLE